MKTKISEIQKISMLVVAYNCAGMPDTCSAMVAVTPEEYHRGDHYEKARNFAEKRGYDKPMVIFDPLEIRALRGQIEQMPALQDKILSWCAKYT